jgi:hypothetical protein
MQIEQTAGASLTKLPAGDGPEIRNLLSISQHFCALGDGPMLQIQQASCSQAKCPLVSVTQHE